MTTMHELPTETTKEQGETAAAMEKAWRIMLQAGDEVALATRTKTGITYSLHVVTADTGGNPEFTEYTNDEQVCIGSEVFSRLTGCYHDGDMLSQIVIPTAEIREYAELVSTFQYGWDYSTASLSQLRAAAQILGIDHDNSGEPKPGSHKAETPADSHSTDRPKKAPFSRYIDSPSPTLRLVTGTIASDAQLLTPGKDRVSFNGRGAQTTAAAPKVQIGVSIDGSIAEALDDYCEGTNTLRSEAIKAALWQAYGTGAPEVTRPCLQWTYTKIKHPSNAYRNEERWTLEIGDGRRAVMSCVNNSRTTLTLTEPGQADKRFRSLNGSGGYLLWRGTGHVLRAWPDIYALLTGHTTAIAQPGLWTCDLEDILRAA